MKGRLISITQKRLNPSRVKRLCHMPIGGFDRASFAVSQRRNHASQSKLPWDDVYFLSFFCWTLDPLTRRTISAAETGGVGINMRWRCYFLHFTTPTDNCKKNEIKASIFRLEPIDFEPLPTQTTTNTMGGCGNPSCTCADCGCAAGSCSCGVSLIFY